MSAYQLQKHAISVPFMMGEDAYLYTAVLNDQLVLFDTGPNTAQGRRYLTEKIDLDQLRYIFITHCHPDHCGLINFLAEESSAQLVVSKHDIQRYQLLTERLAALPGILQPLGFPEHEVVRVHDYLQRFDRRIPLPEDYLILEEQQALLESLGLDYRHCPGHSQSDMVYLFGDYAVTGDVVLHQLFTTPLFDSDYAHPQQCFNSYAAYCQTLIKLRELQGRQLLTAHLQPVEQIDAEIIFYVSKLLSRADGVAVHLKDGKSIYQALVAMFGSQLEMQIFFYLKLSELIFIGDFLAAPELLAKSLDQLGLYTPLESQFQDFL